MISISDVHVFRFGGTKHARTQLGTRKKRQGDCGGLASKPPMLNNRVQHSAVILLPVPLHEPGAKIHDTIILSVGESLRGGSEKSVLLLSVRNISPLSRIVLLIPSEEFSDVSPVDERYVSAGD